jgi:hypothetical protein
MRNKFGMFVLTLALAFGTLPTATSTAQIANVQGGYDVGGYVSGVTTATGSPLLVKYIGNSPNGGVITVDAATGDIELETGIVGSATADLTTECPVSGALGGLIDVSDAACNTLGEVVDAINASPNWRAAIQDGLRSDSSNTLLNTLAETQANVPAGVALKIDGVAVDYQTIALIPVRDDIRWFLQGADGSALPGAGINPNPLNDSVTGFLYALTNVTGTGAMVSGFNVYSELSVNKRPTLAVASSAASIVSQSTAVVTTLLTGTPAATTVDKEFDFSQYGIGFRRGEKVVVRVADAALTNSALQAVGRFQKRTQ